MKRDLTDARHTLMLFRPMIASSTWKPYWEKNLTLKMPLSQLISFGKTEDSQLSRDFKELL